MHCEWRPRPRRHAPRGARTCHVPCPSLRPLPPSPPQQQLALLFEHTQSPVRQCHWPSARHGSAASHRSSLDPPIAVSGIAEGAVTFSVTGIGYRETPERERGSE